MFCRSEFPKLKNFRLSGGDWGTPRISGIVKVVARVNVYYDDGRARVEAEAILGPFCTRAMIKNECERNGGRHAIGGNRSVLAPLSLIFFFVLILSIVL